MYSIVYNLPGGVIVDHPSFEEHPILKRGYMDMGTYGFLKIGAKRFVFTIINGLLY